MGKILARLVLAVALLTPGVAMISAAPASAHPNHGIWYPSGCYTDVRPVWYMPTDHQGIHGDSSYWYAVWDIPTHQNIYVLIYGPIWGAWAWYGYECGSPAPGRLGAPRTGIVKSTASGGLYRYRVTFENGVIDCYEYGDYLWTADCASKSVVWFS